MKTNPKLIDDNPEWTEADFNNAQAFTKLPQSLQATLRGVNTAAIRTPKKTLTTVTVDSDIVHAFQATGNGWQARMNNVLKEWLKAHAANL